MILVYGADGSYGTKPPATDFTLHFVTEIAVSSPCLRGCNASDR
jgi:hypothetical protein